MGKILRPKGSNFTGKHSDAVVCLEDWRKMRELCGQSLVNKGENSKENNQRGGMYAFLKEEDYIRPLDFMEK